jgi:L-cysteine desulfidase
MRKAASLTGAAAEARMLGVQVPIMAITGSGNHGITNFLGMAAVAMELGASRSQTIKALALTSMITIYIKGFTSALTSFCGCAIAPATGIAAGTVYLLGGSVEQMVHAMQSVVGTFAGMLCDGAKESCAYKVSTVTSSAVEYAYLAMEGTYIPEVNGIVGRTIEETFANLGKLNNPGMLKTNEVVVEFVKNGIDQG